MKGIFKSLFYSRRKRGVAAVAAKVRGEERRRRSDVGEVGRSLGMMGSMSFNEGDVDVGRDNVDDGDGATPNFRAAVTAAAAGWRFTSSSTRVERSEVVTDEGSGASTKKKKLALRRQRVVESSPPPHELRMYFEVEDTEGMREQRESSVRNDA